MRLYLLRHGTAEDSDGPDSERALVEKGRKQCRGMGLLLRQMGVAPDLVLSSPLVRARQSSAVTLSALGLERELRIEPTLAPGTDPDRAVASLVGMDGECLLAVGHEPLLSQIAARLVSEGSLRLDLRKGGLVEIEVLSLDPLRAVLVGLLRPGHLDRS